MEHRRKFNLEVIGSTKHYTIEADDLQFHEDHMTFALEGRIVAVATYRHLMLAYEVQPQQGEADAG